MQPPPERIDPSGVFETCRVRNGRVFDLEEHLDRLRASLKTAGLPVRLAGGARGPLLRAARGLRDGSVRVAVRRRSPEILVHRTEGDPYRALRARGVAIATVASRWPAGDPSAAQIKSAERLPGVLARTESAAPEVLRLGPHGWLTEGTVSNFFFVKGDALVTPPSWTGVLEGVTRSRVIAAAGRLGLRVTEAPVTRHELFNAEEAFLTNVMMGILPVRSVDGRRIGRRVPGPVTRRIAALLSLLAALALPPACARAAQDSSSARVTVAAPAAAAEEPLESHVSRLLKSDEPEPQYELATLLLNVGAPSFPVLVQKLDDPDPVVRSNAATAIGWVAASAGQAPPVVVNALIRTLNDQDERVRACAADTLNLIGTEETAAALDRYREKQSVPQAEAQAP